MTIQPEDKDSRAEALVAPPSNSRPPSKNPSRSTSQNPSRSTSQNPSRGPSKSTSQNPSKNPSKGPSDDLSNSLTHKGFVKPKNTSSGSKPGTAQMAIVPVSKPTSGVLVKQQSAKPPLVKPQNGRFNLRKLVRGTFWAVVFGSTALATASLGAIAVLAFPFPRQVSGETVTPPLADLWNSGFRYQVARPVNILIMGLDEAHDVEGSAPDDLVGRTDTMLLARVDPEDKAVNVMSIPRDTRVEIPGYGIEKINQANFEGGAELAAQTVMHNFDKVEIDRYVRVSTAAFREIVDLVGGIEVMVPKPMKYEDKTQGLVIDLEPGLQILNGNEAEQFARFRQDSYGDIGRVQRQQILLKALRQRLTHPRVLPKLPQIVRVLQTYIDTNLSPEEMLALAGFGLNLDSQDLHMVMLPGRFSDPEEYSASYWISDEEASSNLMSTYFDTQPVELVTDDDSRGTNYTKAPSESALSALKIAVQNATDDEYASTSMAEHLRELGFYNVYVVSDWSNVMPETSVVAQRGDIGSARSLQSTLDIGTVEYDSTGDIDSDITIRVGEDWLRQSELSPEEN